jgi:hypothetical protein
MRPSPRGPEYPLPHDFFFPRRKQTYINMKSKSDADAFGLPQGTYWLREYYCLDPECCCNIARIVVVNCAPTAKARAEACIAYGMESLEYYVAILGVRRAKKVEKGMLEPQCEFGEGPNAKEFLEFFQCLAEGAGLREKYRDHYRELIAKLSGFAGERLLAKYERARQQWLAKRTKSKLG